MDCGAFMWETNLCQRSLAEVFMAIDIHTIIAGHRSKKYGPEKQIQHEDVEGNLPQATSSEIPDVFFEEILAHVKLSRIDITVLMYLYRRVWCRSNLYREYGISPMLSLAEMAKILNLKIDELYQAFKHLEDFGFIATIRSGQYFVRKYFTREFDEKFAQTYDDFEI